MTRVLVVNTPGLRSKGGMAVVMGALRCLRQSLSDAQITVVCHHCREDWATLHEICHKHRVQVARHPWFKEHDSRLASLVTSSIPAMLFFSQCVLGRATRKLGLPPKGVFQESDIVLDLNTDALHDHYGIFFPLWALSNILLGLMAGKPLVVWGAGIGTFDRRVTRTLAKRVLDRVAMILAREDVTKEYLKALGIRRPRIYVTADHAFLVEPAPAERIVEIMADEGIVSDGTPLVGVSLSQLIPRYAFPGILGSEEKHRAYVEVMTKTVDYLTDELDARVVLVPHSIVAFEDDRIVSGELYERVERRDRVVLLRGEYMADELKGIIGMCSLFVGCRMHATIASTSMGVPTVAVVYGQKSHGIIGHMMGQEACVVQIGGHDPDQLTDELRAKLSGAWANREAIREELRVRAKAAKERARLNGTLIRDLLQDALP